MKQPTLSEESYIYLSFRNGYHYLTQKGSEEIEKWVANKGHASSGLRWRNTDLEFCGTVKNIGE